MEVCEKDSQRSQSERASFIQNLDNLRIKQNKPSNDYKTFNKKSPCVNIFETYS